MDANLPVFELLASRCTNHALQGLLDLRLRAELGSIGRAIEIAKRKVPGWTPMIAAPGMGRFQAFGNLFAMLTAWYRLDRHPVMRPSGHAHG